jgi:catechol 2,3-dioxygenase-like lactoylglutathione lyase family enzyme
MVRIKHIAIRTPDPEKTAGFYKEVFGLEEVGLARSGYYLSDGHINLAILKSSDEGTGESPREVPGYAGIDHLGFQVDNLEEICQNLENAWAKATNQSTG